MTLFKTIVEIINGYDLGNAIRWCMEHNTSQALPYHNLTHCLNVMTHAYNAWKYERKSKPPLTLMYAAIFHDIDHSGGFYADDADNIQRAVHLWQQYMSTRFDKFDWAVGAFIRVTEYPHKPIVEDNFPTMSPEDYRFSVECLRDADFMKCPDTILQEAVAIKHEMYKHMPWEDYLVRSIEFLEGIEYKTKYGKEVGYPLLQESITLLKDFNHLVNQHD